jgi:hypothetical protein
MMREPRRAAAAIALLCLVVGLAGARTVDIAGTRIETTTRRKIECVPLSVVAAALHGRFWQVDDRFVMLLPGDSMKPGREYILRADSIHALCDGRRVVLPAAPVIDSNRLYLPVAVLAELFPSTRVPELQSLETSRRGDTAVFTFRAKCRPGEKLTGFGDSRSSLEYRLVVGARRDSAFGPQVAILSLTPPGILKSVALDSGAGTALSFSFRQPAAERLSVLSDHLELRVGRSRNGQSNGSCLIPGTAVWTPERSAGAGRARRSS